MDRPGEWAQEIDKDPARPAVIIIGLGNPILGDDGVGWRVVEQIQRQFAADISGFFKLNGKTIESDTLALGGLSLMERLEGYRAALIVDAVETGAHPIGDVFSFTLDELPGGQKGHLAAAHDTSLKAAIEMGRSLGIALPRLIRVVGIEIRTSYDFSESLSREVASALPRAVGLVVGWLRDLVVED